MMSVPLAPKKPGTESPPPAAPAIETVNGKLSENEANVILRATLLPEHREDPNVLRFISAYMRCRHAGQAAEEAGLPARAGANLRNRPDIHLAITRLSEKSVNKYGFDASEVVERVKEVSEIDLVVFENPDGTWKNRLSDIPPEARRAIKKIKVKNCFDTDANGMRIVTGEIIEIEVWDKMKGLELLGREKNTFKDTKVVEHNISRNMADTLLEASRRADERLAQLTGEPVLEIEARKVEDNGTSG